MDFGDIEGGFPPLAPMQLRNMGGPKHKSKAKKRETKQKIEKM